MSGQQLYLSLVLFSVLGAVFALWKGGRAERIAAAIFVVNLLVDALVHQFAPDSEGLARLGNDGLAAAAVLIVTIRYGAPWMGGVMLFYAAQFSLHSYYLVTDRPHDYWHALINNLNWSGIIWCLIIGTALTWRDRTARRAVQPAP